MSLYEVAPPDPSRKRNLGMMVLSGPEDSCSHCKGNLVWTILRTCPDGMPNCCTGHYGSVCERCFAEFLPWPSVQSVRKDIVVLPADPPGRPVLGHKMLTRRPGRRRRRLIVVRN